MKRLAGDSQRESMLLLALENKVITLDEVTSESILIQPCISTLDHIPHSSSISMADICIIISAFNTRTYKTIQDRISFSCVASLMVDYMNTNRYES